MSTGIYAYDLDTTDKPGRWPYRFAAGTGLGQAAAEGMFTVTGSIV